MTALRGINLGGWLVAERWMTPELFQGTTARDEYGLHADVSGQLRDRLIAHRKAFITQEDIAAIRQAGFDFIRVPVGYWLWEKAQGYMDDPQIFSDLLKWCTDADLKVILSLHGAPGSQNGWDHSGRVGGVRWHEAENVQMTLKVIDHIASMYGHYPCLLGISVLNEPHRTVDLNTLLRYYSDANKIVRQKAAPHVGVIISDGFRPLEIAEAMKRNDLEDCILDVHLYQTFDVVDKELTFDAHIAKVERQWQELLTQLGIKANVLVGEWSAMLAAETFVGVGDATRRGMVKRYYDVQRKVFDEATWGWAYWSYKTGGPSVWNWSEHNDLGLN